MLAFIGFVTVMVVTVIFTEMLFPDQQHYEDDDCNHGRGHYMDHSHDRD